MAAVLIEFIFGAERSLMEEKQLKGEEGGGKGEYQQAVVVGTASKKREAGGGDGMHACYFSTSSKQIDRRGWCTGNATKLFVSVMQAFR